MAVAPEIAHHAALDARMVKAARGIKLLSLVSWPAEVQHAFLAQRAAGNTALPRVAYPKHDFSEARHEYCFPNPISPGIFSLPCMHANVKHTCLPSRTLYTHNFGQCTR